MFPYRASQLRSFVADPGSCNDPGNATGRIHVTGRPIAVTGPRLCSWPLQPARSTSLSWPAVTGWIRIAIVPHCTGRRVDRGAMLAGSASQTTASDMIFDHVT